jgi:hypothetical protein
VPVPDWVKDAIDSWLVSAAVSEGRVFRCVCRAGKNEDSRWPKTPMLAYGTFGMRTPAGRRYHIRSSLALAAMAACFLAPALLRRSVPVGILRIVIALPPVAAFVYIAWEFRRNLSALDELARRIQLESIAWTYLSGLAR